MLIKNSVLLFFIVLLLVGLPASNLYSWGFWAHKRINRLAVFTLPPEVGFFFKEHIEYITENAVNPDKRRYATPNEAPRHYIDIDHYGEWPFDNLPKKWSEAVEVFSEDTLMAYGTVPWHVYKMTFWLTDAFRERDKNKIIRIATDMGHYIGDAHVPLHTTKNYNGQLTGQYGIHGFWESRLPELYGDTYDYFVGRAQYIDNPLDFIWKVVLESNKAVDTVLTFEKRLSESFPPDQKYSFEKRGETTVKVFSEKYSRTYHKMLDGQVERRMRASIHAIGSFWYTCWMNAGQPDLRDLRDIPMTEEEKKQLEEEEKNWKKGKVYGRKHVNTGQETEVEEDHKHE